MTHKYLSNMIINYVNNMHQKSSCYRYLESKADIIYNWLTNHQCHSNILGSVQFFFNVFGKSLLCSPRLHLLKLFIKNTVKLVFLQIAQIHKLQTVFYFKMHFLCNISYYYQCLKNFFKCLIIFCKIIIFQDSSIDRKFKRTTFT